MYICSAEKSIFHNESIKEYKQKIKQFSSQNIRRISKFNALAILGALKTLHGKPYNKNLTIYTGSEYGCIESMNKVLTQVSKENEILMPFDFLNVNGNNVGFLIAESLGTVGNNFYITAEDFSFEKSFELAYNDILFGNTKEVLVGVVDESLEDITDYNSYIHNLENHPIVDGSVWFHLSENKKNSLAKIENIYNFTDIGSLKEFIETKSFDHISLNQYARKEQLLTKTLQGKIIPHSQTFFGTQSAEDFYDLLSYKGKLLMVTLDAQSRSFVIELSR